MVDVKKIGNPFPLGIVTSSEGVVFQGPAVFADATKEMKEYLQEIEILPINKKKFGI